MPEIDESLNVQRQSASGLDRCSVCSRPASELEDVFVRHHTGEIPSIICEPCFLEMTVTCSCCERQVRQRETRQMSAEENDVVCNTCYSTHYTQCRGCHRITHRDDMETERFRGRYCNSCAERMVGCTICGTSMRVDNTEDVAICRSCRVSGGRWIKDYSYKPEQLFYKTDDDSHPSLFFGFENELEVNRDYSDDSTAKWVCDIVNGQDPEKPQGFNMKYCYIKHDGSINYGFETVSRPMTLDFHRNFEGWKNLFDVIEEKMRSDSSCGLHVHMSRADIAEVDELKLVRFFEFNQAPLKIMSRRRGGFSYCSNYGSPFGDTQALCQAKSQRAKMRAVNFNPQQTIEIRLFAGTTKLKELLASIELCHAVLMFNKEHSPDETKKPLWFEFSQWVEANQVQYQNLFEEMKTREVMHTDPGGRRIKNYIRSTTYVGQFTINGDRQVEIQWEGQDQATAVDNVQVEDWDSACDNCDRDEDCDDCYCRGCDADGCDGCDDHPNYSRNMDIREGRI